MHVFNKMYERDNVLITRRTPKLIDNVSGYCGERRIRNYFIFFIFRVYHYYYVLIVNSYLRELREDLRLRLANPLRNSTINSLRRRLDQ